MKNGKVSLSFLVSSVGAALIASAFGVGLVALASFLLLRQTVTTDTIPYINTGIKVVCSVVAALLASRHAKTGVLLRAVAAGIAYFAVSFAVFSLVTGEWSFAQSNLIDLAVCALSGAITGIVKNLKG